MFWAFGFQLLSTHYTCISCSINNNILPPSQEFEKNEDKWKKFGALVFGIVGIGFITNWADTIESFT